MRLIVDGKVQHGQAEIDRNELRQEIASLKTVLRYVQRVTCNGQEVNLDELLEGGFSPAADVQVEITTCTMDELLEDTLESVYQYLPRLYSAWKEIVSFWRTGEQERGAERFTETVQGLQWNLSVLTNLSSLGPGDSEIATINRNGQALVPQLLSAWEDGDFVQLTDVLEYEVMPWLDQWFGFAELFRRQMKLEHVKDKLQ